MKEKKIGLFDIYNEVLKLNKRIGFLEKKLEKNFNPIDSIGAVQYDLSNYKVAWYYKGVYYNNPRRLFEKVQFEQGYTKQRDAFVTLLKNNSRQDEMWALEINLVLLYDSGEKHYITSLGNVVSKATLNRIQTQGNTVRYMEHGETVLFNLGVLVFTAFIDDRYEKDSMRHLDSNIANNTITNLAPHEESFK